MKLDKENIKIKDNNLNDKFLCIKNFDLLNVIVGHGYLDCLERISKHYKFPSKKVWFFRDTPTGEIQEIVDGWWETRKRNS